MSETTILWMFGFILSGFGAWMTALSLWLFKVHNLQTQMLTILLLQSKAAGKVLHSPDNHHGLDELLDKYIATIDRLLGNYTEHHHELTAQEWDELFKSCEEIVNNTEFSKGERLAAVAVLQGKFLKELAIHKTTYKGVRYQTTDNGLTYEK